MIIRCAERGFKDFTYYDLEGKTMNFAKWRFAKRGIKVQIIKSSDEEDRLEGKYDSIFCFDVLEHVTEPIKHAERLIKHVQEWETFHTSCQKSVHPTYAHLKF